MRIAGYCIHDNCYQNVHPCGKAKDYKNRPYKLIIIKLPKYCPGAQAQHSHLPRASHNLNTLLLRVLSIKQNQANFEKSNRVFVQCVSDVIIESGSPVKVYNGSPVSFTGPHVPERVCDGDVCVLMTGRGGC